jgi:hyaluronate lyase
MVDIIYLFHGSTWEIKDERISHIYDWAVKSFMTTIWRGSLFANLRGREISRQDGTDYRAADDVISAVIRLIQISPNEKLVVKFKRWVKHNIVSAHPWHDYLDTAPGSLYRAATELMNDDTLKEPKDVNQIVWMKHADRAFMLRPGYAFTLSMSSERIATYECINGGNLKGWYTGSGMTLLYNADLGQYSDGYWATADMYHVPGTTASLNERAPCSGSRKVSPDRWTCGANSGGYASIGMHYVSWDMNANAVKSWFFLDDEIVCLGAGISGQGVVQTTIEQRRIFSQKQITVDGNKAIKDNTWTKDLDGNIPHTIRLQNNVEDAEDIEYYIAPSTDPVIVSKKDQTGSWLDVNNGHLMQDTTPFTRKYANIIIDHGDSPVNASYVYSIRPQPSISTSTHAASFKVLANTPTVQAVQSSNQHVTGAIFFGKAQISGVISANTSCAVTIEQNTSKTEAKVAIELAKPDQPVQIDVMNFPYHYVLKEFPGITVDTKAVPKGLRLTVSIPSTVLAFIR